MTIKQVMEIGCEGMTEEQKEQEQERRLKVASKVTDLGYRMKACQDKKQARKLAKVLNKIKGAESAWLREAAWFMYA